MIFTLILLIAVVQQSKLHNVPAWKSSQLAAMELFASQPKETLKRSGRNNAHIQVRLTKDDEDGWALNTVQTSHAVIKGS